MKRIYYHVDHIDELARWLARKPEGPVKVLIGGAYSTDGALHKLTDVIWRKHSPALAYWLVQKLERGELEVRAMPNAPADLPEGVELP